MQDPQKYWSFSKDHRAVDITIEIPAGEKREILSLKGPGAIECLTLKLSANNPDVALRNNILDIAFDGSAWGQVHSPVGDFFGAAPGINPYQSIPFSVEPDGNMTCRFNMPFKDSVRISLANKGAEAVYISGRVIHSNQPWKNDRSMHFRARWRVDHNLVSSHDEPYDIPYLVAHGKGCVVGAATMLMNPTSVPSSWGNWWGEGDEKIFVDDDEFPSFFGTGSEDYYNYAWSSSNIFAYGYCGQPRNDGPANRGYVTNYRYHILDPIPFLDKLGFYMELLSHGPVPGFSYGRIVYHYGIPGLVDDYLPLSEEDLDLPPLPENWMPTRRYFCANADFFQAEDLVTDGEDFRLEENDIWAGGKVLVWSDESIEFNIPVPESGEYVIVFTARKTADAGSFEAEINDDKLVFGASSLVELEAPFRVLARNYVAASVNLTEGNQTLTLINKSNPNKPVGIDFIWIMKR
jgi:hypothetical protein